MKSTVNGKYEPKYKRYFSLFLINLGDIWQSKVIKSLIVGLIIYIKIKCIAKQQ